MPIFISYARADSGAVQALLRDLERTDARVWMDGQLRGGDAWWKEILRQIRECDVFIFALSDHSMHSKPCQAELDYARRLGVPIIPLQIGPVSSMRAGPFADVQVTDYSRPSPAVAMELYAAIQRVIRDRGPVPHPDAEQPSVPYAYLMRLRNEIDAPTLTAEGQDRILSDLMRALELEDATVRPDILDLMRELKARPDVTWRVANQLDRVLAPVGAPARGSGASAASAGPAQGPRPAPPKGGGGDGWAGPPHGGGPGFTVPPPRGTTPPVRPPGPGFPMAPAGPPPQTPPHGSRRRTAWVLAAVGTVVVVVIAVVLAVTLGKGSNPAPTPAPGPAPGPSAGGAVAMQVTDKLDPSFETLEVVTVTSQGQDVGKLEVSTASPDATLDVSAQAGSASYELDVRFVDLDGNQGSCVGRGTIDAQDGATFTIVVQAVGSGCAASLERQ